MDGVGKETRDKGKCKDKTLRNLKRERFLSLIKRPQVDLS